MSQYYKPHRNPNWNYGGDRWRLSRSKIDLFKQCPKCFYIDNKLGTARPPGFPFNLNSAVDHLLKKEFDIHRVKKSPHPLMNAYGLSAIPYEHRDMEKWRDFRNGISTLHAPTNFTVVGAIDDVWINDEGELHIVDYKATSKDGEVNLDADWQDGYKRQMEIYQWLFRENDFKVSDVGYFVYANAKKDKRAFDAKLEFDVMIIPYTGSDEWVENTLKDVRACLESDTAPKASVDCDYCRYRNAAFDVLGKANSPSKKSVPNGKLF